jgi:putative oxidoreductase
LKRQSIDAYRSFPTADTLTIRNGENIMNQFALTNTARAILRVVLGFLFTAHGWQKFSEWTIAGTQASFGQMGVPAAEIAAPVVATLELAGGIALILGLLTRPVAILLLVNMLGALFLVHAPAGVFAMDGGYELVLLLGTAALTLALVGPGRVSVDYALFGRKDSKLSVLA